MTRLFAQKQRQAGNLAERGGKGKQKSGDAELFAFDGNQVRADGNQHDKQQGKQGGEHQPGLAFGHGGTSEVNKTCIIAEYGNACLKGCF